MQISADAIQRFKSKILTASCGCWIWLGQENHKGYGRIRPVGNRKYYTHRFAWEMKNGEIPQDKMVLHKCDIRTCCNPDHLYLGTHQENMRDYHERGLSPQAKMIGKKRGAPPGRKNWSPPNGRDCKGRFTKIY